MSSVDDLHDTQFHISQEAAKPKGLRLLTSVNTTLYRALETQEQGVCDDRNLIQLQCAKSNFFQGFLNMSNSILGAGMIAMPFAFRCSGILLGICILLTLTFIVSWTIWLIAVNAKLTGREHYAGIVEACFGIYGKAAALIFQCLFAFGSVCAYSIIIGDTIPSVFKQLFPQSSDLWIFNRRFIILVFNCCISFPLSLCRNISKLAITGFIALLTMSTIIVFISISGLYVPQQMKGVESPEIIHLEPTIFQAIGIISFAFVCHHQSLLIFQSLKFPALDHFLSITICSTVMTCGASMVIGICGYLVFSEKTSSNILNNLPEKGSIMSTIPRLAFGLHMMFTFPLDTIVVREVLTLLFTDNPNLPTFKHFMVTFAIIATGTLVSLFISDLSKVLDIVGGVCAGALAYVIPPLCYINLIFSKNSAKDPKFWKAALCLLFGLFTMFLAFYQLVNYMIKLFK